MRGARYDLQDARVNSLLRERLRIKKTFSKNAIFTTMFYGLSIV